MEEIFVIIFGLIIGSFLNVVIYRLPLNKSLIKPGSYCASCNSPVKAYDNIPVLSYLLLMGRCRNCKTTIPIIHPIVEIFTAFSFWLSYIRFFDYSIPYIHYTVFTIIFLTILISLTFIDLFHMILPDELTLGGGILFLIYSFFNPRLTVLNSFGTAFGSALFFAGMYFFYLKVRKIEGLGFGDVKMMLFLGAFLGVAKTVVAIMLASFTGLIVGVFFIAFYKKNMKFALPFGTFLGFGSFVSLFWGERVLLFIRSIVV